MADLPNVRLDLASRPENVMLVREMLTGLAERISLDGVHLNDILTAVTEACNNVALHAYEHEPGPLKVKVEVAGHALNVVVRDHGVGIRSRGELRDDHTFRIGLPVIRALTESVELRAAAGSGTEVSMQFALPDAVALEPPAQTGMERPGFARHLTSNGTALTVAPLSLVRTVLPRLLCALASQAHFSTDRLSDVQLIADALGAHIDGLVNASHLSVAVRIARRQLEVTLGPLVAGGAQRLVADSHLGGVGQVIERLTDSHCVTSSGQYETLTLELIDRRR